MPRRSTRLARGRTGRTRRADDMDMDVGDEVDAFMDGRSRVALNPDEDNSLEDESSEGSGLGGDALMDLHGVASSSEVSTSSEEEDDGHGVRKSGDGDDEEEAVGADVSKAWGRRKATYYQGDDGYSDGDEAEVTEARRLQAQRQAALREEDYLSDEDSNSSSDASGALRPVSGRSKGLGAEAQDDDEDEFSLGLSSGSEHGDEPQRDVSGLTRTEKLHLLVEEAPELLQILNDFRSKVDEMHTNIQPFLKRVEQAQLPTNKGVSFLEAKQQLLLSYCTNVAFYLTLKASGKSIENHPVLDHLIKQRTLLEKLKPLDDKLKPQIDKLLQSTLSTDLGPDAVPASKGSVAAGPRPHALVAPGKRGSKPGQAYFSDDEGGASGDSEQQDSDDAGVYRPPKLMPVRYEEDTKASDRAARKAAKAAARAAKSGLMSYVRDEFGNEPEEISHRAVLEEAIDEEVLARQRYEEENFVRLPASKALQKRISKKRGARGGFVDELRELEDFGDMAALDGAIDDTAGDTTGVGAGEGGDDEAEAGEDMTPLQKLLRKRRRKDRDVSAQLYGVEAPARERRSQGQSADTALPYREIPRTSALDGTFLEDDTFERFGQGSGLPAKEGGGRGGGGGGPVQEDPMYALAAAKAKAKREARQALYAPKASGAPVEEMPGEKRSVGRDISKNKGRTASRKKEISRVKLRRKFKSAVRRRKGAVREVKEKKARYGGEATGVSSHVVRSRRLNDV